MNSAKKYIDEDDVYHLRQLNDLHTYLKTGCTIFDNYPLNFTDMTLIQYAIYKCKPAVLKDMLEISFSQCLMPLESILNPIGSNTKGHLINLAIEFSQKDDKKKYDIRCIEVIFNFAKEKCNGDFNIDFENINGETPLVRAIKHENTEACIFLLQNKADFFYKSKKNSYLKQPFFILLQKATYLSTLQNIIDAKVLGDNNYDKFQKEVVKNEKEITNKIAIKFLKSIRNHTEGPIFTESEDDDDNKNEEEEKTTDNSNESKINCCNYEGCNNQDELQLCKDCEKLFCPIHIDDHDCE